MKNNQDFYTKQHHMISLIWVATIFSLRFMILYSTVFEIEQINLSSLQISFYSGTLAGYLVAAIIAGRLLAYRTVTQIAHSVLALSVVCSLALLVFDKAPALAVLIAIALLSGAISFNDIVIIRRVSSYSVPQAAKILALGFMCAALALGVVRFFSGYRYYLVFTAVLIVMALIGTRFLPTWFGMIDKEETVPHKKLCSQKQGSNLRFRMLLLYLCTFSAVTGISSALYGSDQFGVDLRQSLILFSVIMASFGVLALLAFFREKFSIMLCLACCSGCVFFGLTALVFAPHALHLVISFVMFGAFFFALITARIFVATMKDNTPCFAAYQAAKLFFICQLIQMITLSAASRIFALRSDHPEYWCVVMCVLVLTVALYPALNSYKGSEDVQTKLLGEFSDNSPLATIMEEVAKHDVNGDDQQAKGSQRQPQSQIHTSYDEHPYMSSMISPDLVKRFSLTAREYEVLIYILQGKSRNTIAADMMISPHTVKGHTSKIYQKLNVASKQELIKLIESLASA